MKKMRLPKPVETRVHYDGRYVGSVYTAKQMHKFAEKAVLLEREACAKVCEEAAALFGNSGHIGVCLTNAGAIRARGQA